MSSGKKKLAILFILILLSAIPATFYLVLREQEIRSRAQPATTLSFDPPGPLNKTVGETFTLNIQINTGTNSISGAELHIQYDTTKLTTTSIDIASDPFLPIVLVDGTISGGFAFITLGSQPSQPKKGTGTLATVTFRANASTGGAPTLVRFTTDTRVAGTGEIGNVLASQPAPASVTIGVATTPVPTATSTPTPTSAPSPTGPTSRPLPTSLPGGGTPPAGGPLPTKGASAASPSATPLPGAKGGPVSPLPTAAQIPVAADVGPTAVLTIGGITLFIAGMFALLAL